MGCAFDRLQARKVGIVDGEERRGPRLQPVGVAARFVVFPYHFDT